MESVTPILPLFKSFDCLPHRPIVETTRIARPHHCPLCYCSPLYPDHWVPLSELHSNSFRATHTDHLFGNQANVTVNKKGKSNECGKRFA